MITNFKEFLINEESGINDEIINIANFIYEQYLKNDNINEIILPDNKLNIKKIKIRNIKNTTEFDINKSNNNTITLNLDLNNLNIDNLYHELNHVLQFKKEGKEKTIINLLRKKIC